MVPQVHITLSLSGIALSAFSTSADHVLFSVIYRIIPIAMDVCHNASNRRKSFRIIYSAEHCGDEPLVTCKRHMPAESVVRLLEREYCGIWWRRGLLKACPLDAFRGTSCEAQFPDSSVEILLSPFSEQAHAGSFKLALFTAYRASAASGIGSIGHRQKDE